MSAERKAPKYAPKNADGLLAYVIRTTTWGRADEHIKWAMNLKDAKSVHGWTRASHTSITIRRATPDDVATLPDRGSRRG